VGCRKLAQLTRSTIQDGHIVEEGTYDTLMTSGGAFKVLMDEFGGATAAKEEEEAAEEEDAIEDSTIAEDKPKTNEQKIRKITRKQMGKAAGTGKLEVGYREVCFDLTH